MGRRHGGIRLLPGNSGKKNCVLSKYKRFSIDCHTTSLFQDIFAISGGIIGATNIPERWFPGTLDLIANSHHFMHVMVLLAAYQMHKAVSMDLVWMTMVKQNGGLCSSV